MGSIWVGKDILKDQCKFTIVSIYKNGDILMGKLQKIRFGKYCIQAALGHYYPLII